MSTVRTTSGKRSIAALSLTFVLALVSGIGVQLAHGQRAETRAMAAAQTTETATPNPITGILDFWSGAWGESLAMDHLSMEVSSGPSTHQLIYGLDVDTVLATATYTESTRILLDEVYVPVDVDEDGQHSPNEASYTVRRYASAGTFEGPTSQIAYLSGEVWEVYYEDDLVNSVAAAVATSQRITGTVAQFIVYGAAIDLSEAETFAQMAALEALNGGECEPGPASDWIGSKVCVTSNPQCPDCAAAVFAEFLCGVKDRFTNLPDVIQNALKACFKAVIDDPDLKALSIQRCAEAALKDVIKDLVGTWAVINLLADLLACQSANNPPTIVPIICTPVASPEPSETPVVPVDPPIQPPDNLTDVIGVGWGEPWRGAARGIVVHPNYGSTGAGSVPVDNEPTSTSTSNDWVARLEASSGMLDAAGQGLFTPVGSAHVISIEDATQPRFVALRSQLNAAAFRDLVVELKAGTLKGPLVGH